MKFFQQTIFSVALLSALAVGKPLNGKPMRAEKREECAVQPTTTTSATPTSSTAPARATVIPEYHNIFPNITERVQPPAHGLFLETYNNESHVEQVAIFRGIPSTATNCLLMSSQADKKDRVFIISGSRASVIANQFTDFPSDLTDISYGAVQPYLANTNLISNYELTLWDGPGFQSWQHNSGKANCSETLYVWMHLEDPNTQASIYMQQDEQTGFQLIYDI